MDGRTGKAMVSPYVRSTVGAQTSPLTISAEGYGNDLFLYWKADCHNHEGEGGQYTFVKGIYLCTPSSIQLPCKTASGSHSQLSRDVGTT